ncbi:MAG: amino acid permease [Flavobacteriia bacterium]|nr:MAG: amino acid permease [Flavobacteriia bacterium]
MNNRDSKSLGLKELVAIAVGGMVGGGIFTILGISVSLIGFLTPVAIAIGGIVAALAAYSYVKLGLYYRDEGATYAFVKKTYPTARFPAAVIGWLVIFGYISTLAIYAYTFSSYAISGTDFANNIWARKFIALGVLAVFTAINVWSVNGMGKIEDLMVYSKLAILLIISVILIKFRTIDTQVFIHNMQQDLEKSKFMDILIVASLTFVAYEGFQLVINAVNEMKNPEKNTPRAIYSAIAIVILLYVIISVGALFSIPLAEMAKDKEYALAAGAGNAIGSIGATMVIIGAILATSSAISGTLFGSSRQMAEIAEDGFFPAKLARRKSNNIPAFAVISMAVMAAVLILAGGLRLLVEFGSITFLVVSLLMALINHQIREKTESKAFITIMAIIGLGMGGILILYYEFTHKWEQMMVIIGVYVVLAIGAGLYSKKGHFKIK